MYYDLGLGKSRTMRKWKNMPHSSLGLDQSLCGKKKYSSFVQFTAKSKGDITPKQYAYYSALSNLNFDRYDVTQY